MQSFLSANWRYLAMLNFVVDPMILARLVPPGTEIDFENEGLRRLIVNAAYWGVGLEDKIPANGADVKLVGEYHPSGYHFFDAKNKFPSS